MQTRAKKIILVLALINLVVLILFPPFDDQSVMNRNTAIFYGFTFILNTSERLIINQSLLTLELIVWGINVGIAWLLTNPGKHRSATFKGRLRSGSLWFVAINLVVVLLFPPFEFISHMSQALLPTFEGFYFLFSHPPYRTIVTPVLYLEVMLVLVNGGILWLWSKERPSLKLR